MQFEEMKYSGEAKMSSGQRLLEEFQVHLEEAKAKSACGMLGDCCSPVMCVCVCVCVRAGQVRVRPSLTRQPACWAH